MVNFSRFRLAVAPLLLAALVVGASACYGEGDEPVAADTARYATTETAAPVPPPPPATTVHVVDGYTGGFQFGSSRRRPRRRG